jgi:uncharacterized RDD family membrane protein YckC
VTTSEHFLSIDTPENVAFGYPLAGIGSRFLAALLDTALIIILQLLVNFVLLLLGNLLIGNPFEEGSTLGPWFIAIAGLVAFLFLWGYYIFFEMLWNGQSPGKRWIGLRVIRVDGTPITLSESIIRNLVRLIDFLPSAYGVGVVVMFIQAQSRRLGDLAAGTLVVRDRAIVTLESLRTAPTQTSFGLSIAEETIDYPVERLSSQDLYMAEDFLRRRLELANQLTLAAQIAQALLRRMDLPDEGPRTRDNVKVIAGIVRASQKRLAEAAAAPPAPDSYPNPVSR